MKTGGAVFGAIVGGNDVEERQRCAAEVVKRYVSGSITCSLYIRWNSGN